MDEVAMSLHDSASQVQSAGRGDDKVLVHMTPGEVSGLQSLAMAHGGSLTINPHTGLPEAGFLSSLLPMAIGFGLAPLTGGLSAALITGAGYTAATGSLKKGIMAGLGAYSGAGLAGGLNAMGAQNAAAGTIDDMALASKNAAANSQIGNMYGNANAATTAATNTAATAPYNWAGGPNIVSTAQPPVPPPVQVTPQVSPPADPFAYAKQTNENIVNTVTKNNAMKTAPVRGAGSQRLVTQDIYGTTPKVDTSYTPRAFSGPNAARSGVRTIEVDDFVPKEINLMPDQASRGLSGVPPEGQVFDKAQFGYRAVPSNQTVIAKQLPPLEARTSPIPIVNRSGMQTVIEKPVVRSEILSGDASLASPRSLTGPYRDYMSQAGRGAKNVYEGGMQGLKDLYAASEAVAPYSGLAGLGSTAYTYYDEKREEAEEEARRRANQSPGMIRPYEFTYGTNVSTQPYYGSAERTYFQPTYTELPAYEAPGPEYEKAAKGGLMGLAVGGPVEQMAAMNSVGANTGYPMASINTPVYSNPMMQRPEATNVVAPSADAGVGTYSGEMRFARGGDTAEPESSGYTYSYDPNTTQFTQTGGPGAMPSSKDLANGIGAADSIRRFTEMQATGNPYNFTPSWAKSGATPNGPVSGGVATPMMQPAAPAQSFVPNINIPAYQTPEQQLGLGGFYDYMNQQLGGYSGYAAGGGVSHLGDYSDGGRLLKGPGDGVSDSIPASIGNRQPARLADGEFVVPARIVSEIGNGSTEAGARKLYAMMDRVQKARRKTVGKGQVAANTKAEKLLPA